MSFDPISYTEFRRGNKSNSDSIETLDSKVETLTERMDALYPGFDYQGSVATVAALPSGATTGQSYTVAEKGNALYVYNGTEWIEFDMNYITSQQIQSMYQ